MTVLLVILMVILSLFALMFYTADKQKYKVFLAEQLKKEMGIDVVIDGPMNLSLFPNPHVILSDVKFSIDLKNDDKIDLGAQKLSLTLPWNSLRSTIKEIKNIEANEISIKYFENKKELQSIKLDKLNTDIVNSPLHMDLPQIVLVIGEITINGNLHISFVEHPKITGNLRAKRWKTTLSYKFLEQQNRTILTKTYSYDWLKNTQAQVNFLIETLVLQDATFNAANFDLELNDKVLKVNFKGEASKELKPQNDKAA